MSLPQTLFFATPVKAFFENVEKKCMKMFSEKNAFFLFFEKKNA